MAIDDEDRILLVRQFRLAAGRILREIPAGGLDVAADGTKEEPEHAARRELEEETGLRAGTWRHLGSFFSAPGFTEELMHLYLATDLRPAAEDGRLGPDEDERLLVERVPWRDALADAERGEIVDAKSLVGLFWLARLRGEPAIEGAAPAVALGAIPVAAGAAGASDVTGAAIDGDRVAVTYQLSRHEYAMATVAVSRRSRFLLVMALVWLGLGAFSWVNGDMVLGVVGVLLGSTFVTGLFAYPFVWLQVRRRRDLFEAPHTFTADPNGTTHTTPLGGSAQAWPVFRRALVTGGFVLFDTGAGFNMFVPVRAFTPSELGILYRLLDRAGLIKGRTP